MDIEANVPMTIVCSKASEDIRKLLVGVMEEHNISADLMCMVLRDACSYFERMRANDYNNAIIQQYSQIEQLQKEVEALKQMNGLFGKEGGDDNTIN